MSGRARTQAAKSACLARSALHRRAMSLELALLARPAAMLDRGLVTARMLLSILDLLPGRSRGKPSG